MPEKSKITEVDVTALGIEPLHCPSCHQPTMALVNPWPIGKREGEAGFFYIGLAECFKCYAWFAVSHGLN